jgi:chemotaxis protein methyltransferase CheR
MIPLPNPQEVARFRASIATMMGLHFDDSKFNTLARTLHNRVIANGLDCVQYLDRLALRPGEEIGLLARELTVTETFFLRNIDQFHAFAEVALPARLTASAGKKNIEVLSAGCASGEEPYSLAMTVREKCPHSANSITVTAIDINLTMLQKAAQARYSNWSLRDVSDERKNRWFAAEDNMFVLDETLRKAVHFEPRNLADGSDEFWRPERFDIVFCRNVLMYFSNEQAQATVAKIARAMTPGGYFFLGHAETMRGLSNDFHLCHTNGTFYYQRKDKLEAQVSFPANPVERWQPKALPFDTGWIDAIQRASDRIHALIPPSAQENHISVTSMADRKAPDLHHVFESLSNEHNDRSLDQTGNLSIEHALDLDALLLKAVSLSQSGALVNAEAVCHALLECNELNAGAHYVLALCREGSGDINGAIEHDQTAAYLDAHFAMPRLHLGLLSRRLNEHEAAQKNLAEALLLLQNEDASRILLFGGGFKREALMALCRAELTALGENK